MSELRHALPGRQAAGHPAGVLPCRVAHFHAYHAGRRASVSVDGTVLAGSLEPRAMQFVHEWAGLHRQEILASWDRARRSEPLLDIPPLP